MDMPNPTSTDKAMGLIDSSTPNSNTASNDEKLSNLPDTLGLPTETSPNDIAQELGKWRSVILLIAMGLAGIIGAVMATGAMLIIPSICEDFGIKQIQAQWVVSSSTLSYGCGMLFAGRFADLYGRRLLFLLGMGFSLICTVVTPVCNSLIPLCVLRALAGLGQAVASPAIFGILGTNFRTDPLRTASFAFIAMGAPLGSSFGPVLGGLFAQGHGHHWKYLFYVLTGFIAVPLVLGWLTVPLDRRLTVEEKNGMDRRVDWIGGGMFTLGVCLLLFSITQGGIVKKGWKEPYVPVLFSISIILLLLFLYWETITTRPPMVRPAFLRKAVTVFIVEALLFLGVPAMVYLITIQYQLEQGISGLGCAARMLVLSLVGVVVCIVTIYTVPRFRLPYIVPPLSFVSGICGLLYSLRSDHISFWACDFLAMLCLAWGSDTIAVAGGTIISNLSKDDEQSVNGAAFQTVTQICVALSNCLASLVVQLVSRGKEARLREGLKAAFGMTAGITWTGVLVSLVLMWNWGLAKDVR